MMLNTERLNRYVTILYNAIFSINILSGLHIVTVNFEQPTDKRDASNLKYFKI